MHAGKVVGALAALLWTASCVSILGVDAEDYEDIDETICSCVGGRDVVKGACEELVQGLLERDGAQEKANACVAESATCTALDACLAADVCIPLEGTCSRLEGDFQVRCCAGAECLEGTCAPPCEAPRVVCEGVCCAAGDVCEAGACATPCFQEGDVCDQTAGMCCAGLTCGETGSCRP